MLPQHVSPPFITQPLIMVDLACHVMPYWVMEFARPNPLRYIITAMRDIYIKGIALTRSLPQLIPLCICGLLASAWAIISLWKNA